MLSIVSQISNWLELTFQAHATLLTALGIISSIIAIIEFFFHPFRRVISWLRNVWRLLNHLPTIPTETVRIIPNEHRASWSTVTWANGLPRTILSGKWYMTNIISSPVFILAIYIRSPRKARSQGYISTPASEPLCLQPGTPTTVDATFNFCPAIHREGKAIKATVVFLDQYKNKYILKNTLFKPPSS